MTPQDFIRKWKPVALTERATAQEHFLDLCRFAVFPLPVERGDPFPLGGKVAAQAAG